MRQLMANHLRKDPNIRVVEVSLGKVPTDFTADDACRTVIGQNWSEIAEESRKFKTVVLLDEAQLSERRREKITAEVITPLRHAGEQNQFAAMLRRSLTEGGDTR